MLRTLPACDSARGTAVIAPLSTVGVVLDSLVVHDRLGKTGQECAEIRGVRECMRCFCRSHCSGWGTLSQNRPPRSLRVFQPTCSSLSSGRNHALTTTEKVRVKSSAQFESRSTNASRPDPHNKANMCLHWLQMVYCSRCGRLIRTETVQIILCGTGRPSKNCKGIDRRHRHPVRSTTERCTLCAAERTNIRNAAQ